MLRTTTAVLALALCSAVGANAQTQTLVINSFGGVYEQTHRKCIIEPFEKATGASVKVVTAYSADAFAQLRAQKAAPQFDILHFSGGQEIVGAAEGLLAPIDAAKVPALADVYDIAKKNLAKGEGPAYQIAAIGLIVNTKSLPNAPTSWNDILDPKLGEHTALTDMSNSYGMLAFLMLNQVRGGTLDNIQPGLDAVKAMLKAGATVMKTSPEIQQAFAQGEAWVAPYASDYAFTLKKANMPAKFVQGKEGTPASFITVNVVAGRPNADLAHKFVNQTMTAEAQACFAEAMRYSPTNAKAKVSDDAAADIAYGEKAIAGMIRFDPPTIEKNRAAWVDAWNKAIAK